MNTRFPTGVMATIVVAVLLMFSGPLVPFMGSMDATMHCYYSLNRTV